MHSIISEDIDQVTAACMPWKLLENRTITISGASGFLPSYLVHLFLRLNERHDVNCRVIGLVRSYEKAKIRFSEYLHRKDFRLIECDVSRELPEIDRSEIVIHAASQASPKYYGVDPVGTMCANLTGTLQLLELAKSWASERFLFFSSSEVYGQVPSGIDSVREDCFGFLDPLDVRSCYAESKRAAETLINAYRNQFGIHGLIVRPFHTYGPGMALDDGRVFADFVRDATFDRDIVIKGDGTAKRSFCYLRDALEGFIAVLLKGKAGTAYNVANANATCSIRELADLVVSLPLCRELSVRYENREESGYLPSRINYCPPNTSALEAIGWEARTSLAEGFDRTIRFCKSN